MGQCYQTKKIEQDNNANARNILEREREFFLKQEREREFAQALPEQIERHIGFWWQQSRGRCLIPLRIFRLWKFGLLGLYIFVYFIIQFLKYKHTLTLKSNIYTSDLKLKTSSKK